MPDDTTALIDRARSLLETPLEQTPWARARIEYTLTEGYARALALEAERRRIEQRIAELVTALERDHSGAGELAALAERRSRTDGELSRLRTVLVSLRERLRGAPPAQPSAST